MAMSNNFWSLILIPSMLITSLVCSEDVCVKRTPCMCVFPNGTGVDLKPVVKSSFYDAPFFERAQDGTEYKLSTYYFHPCADALTNRTNKIGDTCDSPLSMYRVVSLMKVESVKDETFKLNGSVCNYLGKTDNMVFSNDGRAMIYENPPSKTTVLLTCAQGENQLHITSLADPRDIVLTFYSRDACLKQLEEPGRSFGSTLLIIFFSFVIFYLVLGVCTKKFLMGATGIEVIPNLAFWTDLPNLVRDGWAFAISGFKLPARGVSAAGSPDPNSYDSI